MPEIVPIRDLKNAAKISELCRSTNAPVFVTKNGYGDMVIMSMQCYEQALAKAEIYKKLEEAERDVDRLLFLKGRGFVSDQQLADARVTVDALVATARI